MIRFATIGTSVIVDRFLEAAALCEGTGPHGSIFKKEGDSQGICKKARSRVYLYRSKGAGRILGHRRGIHCQPQFLPL